MQTFRELNTSYPKNIHNLMAYPSTFTLHIKSIFLLIVELNASQADVFEG